MFTNTSPNTFTNIFPHNSTNRGEHNGSFSRRRAKPHDGLPGVPGVRKDVRKWAFVKGVRTGVCEGVRKGVRKCKHLCLYLYIYIIQNIQNKENI